jgi:hypothetical protein
MPVDPLSATNQQLYKVYTNLAELTGVQVNALTKQTSMMDMVTSENQRLTAKKNTIDQAVENQKRIIYFNDNSRKVSSAWLRIIITITLALGALFLVRLIYFHEYIPDMLFNVLVVAIISITILMVFNYYKGIRARDRYNFDELRLDPPQPMADPNATSVPSSSISPLTTCIGSQCCIIPTDEDPGTHWNPILGKCMSAPVSSPPPLPYDESEDQVESSIQPSEPFENRYAFIR